MEQGIFRSCSNIYDCVHFSKTVKCFKRSIEEVLNYLICQWYLQIFWYFMFNKICRKGIIFEIFSKLNVIYYNLVNI